MRLINGRVLFLVLAVLLVQTLCNEEDPYSVLGLSRKASTKEIKGAYKALVKEWHPDKNSSPNAAEKFMAISKAYETLSDPLKRERYDKFGTFDDAPQHGRHGGFGGGRYDSFFGYGFGGFEDGYFATHRISLRTYTHSIFDRTNQQPYIIYAYSNYCQLCYRLQNVWKAAVQDLEPLGYGIATVNALSDGNLLERLRISQLPSIVAVVEGRVVPLRQNMLQLNDKMIRQFAQKVIPQYFMTRISSQMMLSRFVEQWKTTNKIAVVILGAASEPRTRYLLAAMKYTQFARFAYIHLGDPSEEVAALRESVGVKCTQCENVLIYNDFEDDAVARLSISHISQLKKEALDDLIEKHKLLTLPRLSSTALLDGACPVSSRSPRLLCVVLPIMSGSDEQKHVDAFRQYVKENAEKWAAKKVQFAYVYVDKQSEWIRPFLEKRRGQISESARDLLVFWRLEYVKAKFTWLEDAWTGRKEQPDEVLLAVVEQRKRLDETARVALMQDEYALSWFTRWGRAAWRALETAWFYLTHEEAYMILSAVGTLLLIMAVGWGLNYASQQEMKTKKNWNYPPRKSKPNDVADVSADADWHPDDPKARKEQEVDGQRAAHNRLQRVMSVMRPLMHELRAETYFGMIRLLKPGCRSFVVIVDEESQEQLLQQFAQYIYPFRNNKTLSFGYLVVPKNLDWFRKLLEHLMPSEEAKTPKEAEATMYNKLKSINPRQCIGTVLSLCGWKLYFSIYHPKHVDSARKDYIDTDEDVTSSSSDEDSYKTDEMASLGERKKLHRTSSQRRINVNNVLDGFPNWLDRLLEGSIRRYYIPEWPNNLK